MEAREDAAAEALAAAVVAAVARIRLMKEQNRKKAILRQKVTIRILFVFLCCNRNLRQKVSIISYFYCAVKFSKEKNQKVLIMEPKTISQLCRI